MKLDGRVALVTGAARGIGRALAIGLAREGADVAISYFSRGAAAASLVREVQAMGRRSLALQADVSVASQVDRLVDGTVEGLGRLDILVNNAITSEAHKPWTEITEDDWDRVQDVNLKGCFLCFRAAYPHLLASGHGRVINISSVTFWVGHKKLAHYVASKGGVIGFTRALAREIGTEGITVNAVTPGAIQTEAELEQFADQVAVAEDMARLQSIPRRGVAADIAGAVVFLATDDASFITGQTINVDGGWALH